MLIVLAHPEDFVPTYSALKQNPQENKAMLDAIDSVKEQLENSNDPLGIHHLKDNIPVPYKKKYNLQSLYHYEMPHDFRLMYTVRRSVDGKEALFLELLSHDEYNKLFGYFKKKSH